MKFVTYAENSVQLENISELQKKYSLLPGQLEVVVGFQALSRFSETSKENLMAMIAANQLLQLPLVLEWDVLKQDALFKKLLEEFKTLPLHEFSAVRVQDPGALHFIKEHFPWLKIQLTLENGNHNLAGLKRWCDYLGNQLDRLILSNELSKDHLSRYAADLQAPIEVLGFGRILLFYSPRNLLSPLTKEETKARMLQGKNLEAFGTSEESPHAGFPLIENQHGTFMFNVKDLSLVDHLHELKSMGIKAVRFDLRFDETFRHLEIMLKHFFQNSPQDFSDIRAHHTRPVIKGFYNINKTDVLFSKLKNKRIERQDENYLGEIVDVERDFKIAMIVKSKGRPIQAGDEIKVVTPEGKTKVFTVNEMLSSNGLQITSASTNEIILFPYVRGIVTKSQVYLNSKT